MSTIKDVAKRAGVAVSTASYALSGRRPVAEETRQRILRAIEELNYQPNLVARSLINKRTRLIALLYPALYMSSLEDLPIEFIASVTNVTYEQDYGLLLFTHPLGEPEIKRFIHDARVDGVILMEVLRHDPRVALMKRAGFPFSLIGHCAQNEGISFVDMDFHMAYCLAVEHLAALQHHEIAYLPPIADLDKVRLHYLFESIRGFRETVAKMGVHGTIHGCEPTIEGGYNAMKDLLAKQPGITAVIVHNELIYSGVSRVLQEKGLHVPDDFSVISSASNRSAEKYTPKLTTISVPAIEMGRLGTEFLIRQLEDPHFEPQQVLLPPEFTVRQSTGPGRSRST